MRLAGKMSKRVSVIVKTTCQTTSRSTPAGEPIVREVGPKVHFAAVLPLVIKLNQAREAAL